MRKNNSIISIIILVWILSITLESAALAESCKDKYISAEACYESLKNNPKKRKYKDKWLDCIHKFGDVYKTSPSGPWAPAGLYSSGILYWELYQISKNISHKDEAVDILNRIIKRFPNSKYKKKAKLKLDSIKINLKPNSISNSSAKLVKLTSKSKKEIATKSQKIAKKKKPAKNDKRPRYNKPIIVTGLRHWSNLNYTRVVIDAKRKTSYSHGLLKKDASAKKPQRLYIDVTNGRLGKKMKKIISINDNLLIDARAAQNTVNSVRVVIDIKSFKNYKIFSLKDPFRIVIDVWGKTSKSNKSALGKGKKDLNKSSLAKQLSLGVRRIVIDPGHGGQDYGALGYLKGVYEKDIALKIAKILAKKIRKRLNCEVLLTRNSDRGLALEERTAFANTKNADLFISIHTNAAHSKKAFGIETYFLNLSTDEEAIMVAARENATSKKNISDLQTILNDLMQHAKINESSRLAFNVQNSLYKNMRKKYSKIKNKGVKQAPFYVLLGAQMPSILIETSFISNPRECKRLVNKNYQNYLCDAILKGISRYIKETHPATVWQQNPKIQKHG